MTDKPTPTDAELFALIKEHFGLDQRRDDTVINRSTGRFHDAQRYRDFAAAIARLEKWGQPAQKTVTVVPAPPPPPECETEAERRAFAFGWFKAQEAERMKAESVLEDAARLDWLDQQCEGYGFQDIHEGNRWEISGPYANVRQAIDYERAARKQGEK